MRRRTLKIAGIVLCAGMFFGVHAADPSQRLRGEWSLNNWTPGNAVNLKLGYRDGSRRWQWGSDQSLDDLHGLTREQLRDVHGTVAFSLKRDAGTFSFEGTTVLGIGHGDYRFLPDPSFQEKLGALGYDTSGEDDLSMMMLAVRDVSLAYAADVKQSGLRGAAIADLVRLLDHGVDPGYVARIHAAGFDGLTTEEVIKLHDHGVD